MNTARHQKLCLHRAATHAHQACSSYPAGPIVRGGVAIERTALPGHPAHLARRLARLTGTFAALNCPQRGEAGAVVANSQGKVYLVDPLLAWLPSRLRAGLAEPEMTTLTEMALGVTLARAVDAPVRTDPNARSHAINVRVADQRRTVPINSSLYPASPRSRSCRTRS